MLGSYSIVGLLPSIALGIIHTAWSTSLCYLATKDYSDNKLHIGLKIPITLSTGIASFNYYKHAYPETNLAYKITSAIQVVSVVDQTTDAIMALSAALISYEVLGDILKIEEE